MDPVRELPYWHAAMALLIEAGQMTASDYVQKYPKLPLASKGASTDVIRTFDVHPAASAYERGMNIKRNADKHAGTRFTARFDFKEFFPSFDRK